jgi:hypothetical protein
MKLKYVPAMYTNRSTSIHTHGLVSCTRDFILHNPIDENLNLQQIVSEPATNNVRPHNKVLYHHIKLQSMCISFFSRPYHIYAVCCTKAHVLLTGENDRPSTGRVEPVRGCLNNPSRLVWTTLTSLTAPLAALRSRKETKEKVDLS